MSKIDMAAAPDEKEEVAPEALTKKLIAADVQDIPPWESPAPEITDGKSSTPSNIIEGAFGEKRTAVMEAEKQAAKQYNAAQKTPKDKPGKKPEVDKSKKAVRAPRLPKGPKQTDCQGQTGYSAKRLDSVVGGIIRHIFENMRSIPKSEVVSSGLMALQKEQESRSKATQRDYAKAVTDLSELKAEVLRAIRGESKFSPELLSELIAQAESKVTEIEAARDAAKQELDSCRHRMQEMQVKYDEVISWTELYDAADLAAKKMIVANLINRIEVGTDYQIHIDLNIDLEHFNIQLDFCTYAQGKTA